jgi:hypothetical protein
MKSGIFLLFFGFVLSLLADEVDVSKLPLPVPRKIDFSKEVYPILKEHCLSCHGSEKPKGKYRMDTREGVIKKTKDGSMVIPGNSEKSVMIHMVAGLVEEGLMPPPSDKPGESRPLTKEEIGILRAWIDQGLEFTEGEIKEADLEFSKDIAPLVKSCLPCHGPEQQKGDFRADTREAFIKGGSTYGQAVKPGDAKSPIIPIVSGLDEDLPEPGKHQLTAKQIEAIKTWIEQGAK